MSYIDTLEQAAETARNASNTASEASQIMYDVANGDADSTVSTASGPVKTVAKAIQDISDQVRGGVLSPVRDILTSGPDQSTFIFDKVNMAATTIYVNGILRIDYTIDNDSHLVIDLLL